MYGASRARRTEGTLPESVPCAFCDGNETELVNPFGGQLSVAQYWCRKCRTAFEYIKWGKPDSRE
ncbi:MAG TPA: hypothetical protein VHG28_14445 [Longimicrobiaceae bacterium]|nr:hypothetical protein [Longimicrobiaceae bacterium]